MNNKERARAIAQRVKEQLQASVGKGLNAARIFLTNRIKETASVPAPRVLSTSKKGDRYYRATTRAVFGAPVRKVSGRLVKGITSQMITSRKAVIGVKARSEKGFNYPLYHEKKGLGTASGQHPFMAPTYRKYKKAVDKIVKGYVAGGFF